MTTTNIPTKFRGVVNCKRNSSLLQYETVNLGTWDNPQNINLSKGCTQQEISSFIKLLNNLNMYSLGHTMI
jgi:hypothetical protein